MNYVFSIAKSDIDTLLEYYQDVVSKNSQEHVLAFFQSDEVSITIYKSLKVMLQGKNAKDEYLMWSDLLGFEPILQEETKPKPSHNSNAFQHKNAIGSDEVGTGDFFGPVVVCAAYVGNLDFEFLDNLHVKDSKKLSDDFILKIGESLIKKISYQVVILPNPKFNELTNQGYNMNKIKAYLHNHAIRKLLAKINKPFEMVIIDEFCSKEHYFTYLKDVEAYSNITFLQKAEDLHQSVAVASIIARFTFLKEMDKLNSTLGIILPLGAGVGVDLIGKRIALEKGFGIFQDIAKVNFKNFEKIKNLMK
ncbi:MAG: ribonuclease HIII [Firmicutes bacterium]|nr:ribonuclease HIII [Bacillota bacterium]